MGHQLRIMVLLKLFPNCLEINEFSMINQTNTAAVLVTHQNMGDLIKFSKGFGELGLSLASFGPIFLKNVLNSSTVYFWFTIFLS